MKITEFKNEYSFLSNFYGSPASFDGILYPTSEHAYQAAKTLSQEERNAILAARTPAQAKKLGKKVTLRGDWNDVRINIMYEIITDKFNRNEILKKKLLETGDSELEEGNWWNDTFWGVCKNVGQNHLGKLLMKYRNENKVT